jgi:hypothetical protein
MQRPDTIIEIQVSPDVERTDSSRLISVALVG